MKRVYLGFSGKPGHGKNLAARAIQEAFPQGTVQIHSISDRICRELGINRDEIENVHLLQEYGEKKCRIHGPTYWLDQIEEEIRKNPAWIHVLTNVRRIEEARALASRGWRLARIIALNPNGSLYVKSDRDLNHPLETDLDSWNFEFRLIARISSGKQWLKIQAIALANYLLHEDEQEI